MPRERSRNQRSRRPYGSRCAPQGRAKEHDIDLVMMSTYGYGGIKRRLLGSVTDRVIRASETPVLVLPAD